MIMIMIKLGTMLIRQNYVYIQPCVNCFYLLLFFLLKVSYLKY
jgi:hypothetical protein